MAKKIELTKGRFALVDDELHPALTWWSWFYSVMRKDKPGYAVHRIKVGGRWASISMHRFIMQAGERDIVDHIDGDTLNNQRSNLRLVDPSTNSQNSIKQVGISGYRGVWWSDVQKAWEARIQKSGKAIFIGYFKTDVDAARAYDEKALELFGKDAMTNARLLERRIKKLQIAK